MRCKSRDALTLVCVLLGGAVAGCGSGALLSAVTSPPQDAHVTVRLHVDMLRGRLFVDLVDRNWSAASDTLVAAGPQSVTVALPTWLRDASLSVRTAADRGVASITASGDSATIQVDGIDDIVTVIVESQP